MSAPLSAPAAASSTQYQGSTSDATLYFVYGSNLSFSQMGLRCPDSRFQGRASLHNYRFQINQRGYAKVIPDPSSFVEGLCYSLNVRDEGRLDRNEGVPWAYQKVVLDVALFPPAEKGGLRGRRIMEIVEERKKRSQETLEALMDGEEEGDRANAEVPATNAAEAAAEVPGMSTEPVPEPAKALVYLSDVYTTPDRPWDEYITRMELGLQEALDLGVSQTYVDNEVRPFLVEGKGVR